MDQVYDRRRPRSAAALRTPCIAATYDVIIIGSGAGGGTMAHALAPTGARILILERGDFVPQEDGELGSGRRLEAAALPDDRTLARRRRPRVPAVHALQRRRQHQVLGQRALPAAARGLPGGRARGRRLAGVADRLRHAGAVLRSRRAAVSRARRRPASIRPSRRAGRIPTRRCRTRRAWRELVDAAARAGTASLAAAARTAATRRRRRLRPVQHLQLVSVPASTRRAKPTSAACARR